MIETSARLLQLLGLLQSGEEWTGPRLAERLSVEARTVRRDVDRLRALGYPIETRRGVQGGYRLGRNGNLPPLLLDSEEALAVAVGLRSAAVRSVEGANEAADRALAKLDKVLPPTLRARMMAMDAGLITLPSGTRQVSGRYITVILQACDAAVRLRFDYLSAGRAVSERDTEPHRLVQAGRRWYLVAWDLERDEWRTFRVDRMSRVRTSTFTFAPRDPDLDAAALVSRAVSNAPYQFQARVLLGASLERVSELVPPTVGMVLPYSGDECWLLTGSNSLFSLAFHLVSLDLPMRILDPPELIDLMGEIGRQLIKTYDRSRPEPPAPTSFPPDRDFRHRRCASIPERGTDQSPVEGVGVAL